MPASPDRTLVFAFGALGDSVLLWPTLRAIRPLTLIAPAAKARLAGRWIEGVRAVDGEDPAFSRLFAPSTTADPDPRDEPPEPIQTLLAGAERILSFVSRADEAWARNVRRLNPGAELYCVRPRPAEDGGEAVPVVEHHRRQLAAQGWAVEPIHPAVRRNPAGPIVVHPGSGGRAKCWPAERFEALLAALEGDGHRVVLTLGEAELERMDPGRLADWRRRYAVEAPDGLEELADRLAGAAAFVGNDAGPTHLAGQLGIPTVALFGPTDPRVWAPPGPAVTVLAPDFPRPMDRLPVEPVVEAARTAAAAAGAAPHGLS